MSTEHNHSAGGPSGYETRDANPESLIKLGIGLALLLLVVWVGMLWLRNYFERVMDTGPAVTPFSALHERQLPPLPRVQVEPVHELDEVRALQSREVDSYGWVDRAHGVVRIPISQAMDLILARGGLPARQPAGGAGAAAAQPTAGAKPGGGKAKP